jgi:hypothetical protein
MSSQIATSSNSSSVFSPPSEVDADQQYGIVLGCPRSGTTYLSRLLKTIPEFESMIGTLLPVAIPHIVNQPISQPVYEALAVGFERSLDDYLHSGRYHSRAMAVQKWFNAPTGLGGFYRALFRPRPQPKCMIYKEPLLAFAPEFVLDAFPKGKILHIYRDGRDCANSLVSTYDVLTDEKLRSPQSTEARMGRPYDDRLVPWWVEEGREKQFIHSTPYVRSIWMWKYMVRRCHEAFARLDPEESQRVLTLRYEDLVRSPMEHGEAIVEFFGGEPTPALRKLLSQARTSSIGKHKRRDPAEIQAAERVAGDELAAYGYRT